MAPFSAVKSVSIQMELIIQGTPGSSLKFPDESTCRGWWGAPGHVGLEHASTTRQWGPRKCRATATAAGWKASGQVRSSRLSMPKRVW